MRFLAITGATVAGAAVAGQVVRKGGIRLGVKLQEEGGKFGSKLIGDVREIRDLLDNMEGVARSAEAYLPENANKLFWESDLGAFNVGGKQISDGTLPDGTLQSVRGWFQTYEEKQTAQRLGKMGVESIPDWTFKNEVTQRLISQSRRLPYELPAAYVTQRGLIDPLFGTNDNQRQVNWANPLDVVSDFVTQSLSNVAFMFSPLEAGQAAASTGYREVMSYGLKPLSELSKRQQTIFKHTVSLKGLLEEVGQDATSLLNKGIDVSSQASGAFSTAVKAQEESQGSLVDLLHFYRHGVGDAWDKINQKAISRSAKWQEKAKALFNLDDPLGGKLPVSPFDYLPAPFGGLASGVGQAKAQWTAIGQQRSAVRKMMSGGIRSLGSDERLALNEALQSSSSSLDDLLSSLNKFGTGKPVLADGTINPQWKQGTFYQGRMNDLYNTKVLKQLEAMGVSKKDLYRFQQTTSVAPLKHGAPLDLSDRVRVGSKGLYGQGPGMWQDAARQMGVKDVDLLSTSLPKAIDRADQLFKDRSVRHQLDRQVANEWNVFYNEAYPRLGESVLGRNRLPYQMFQGNISRKKQEFLTRKTAEMTGLPFRDEVGKFVSDSMVDDHLKRLGFDPTNFGQMRAFLAKRKVLANPWNKDGRNVFGMRAVSLESALSRGYFSANPDKETEIRSLLSTMQAREPWAPISSFKMPGVYEGLNGQSIDFNTVRRGFRKFSDKLYEEFQIPLIHLSPLKTMGYGGFRDMREAPMLQYMSGNSFQPFTEAGTGADFYIWAKAHRRGSKGTVTAIGRDSGLGGLRARDLPGKYRAINNVGNKIEARQVKIAAGDLGMIPVTYDEHGNPVTPTRFQKFKDFMHVSDHQPDSLLGWLSRFRQRKGDINNPVVMARLLQGKTVEAGKARLVLDSKDMVVRDITSGDVKYGRQQVAEAYDKFPNLFRARGVPNRVSRVDSIAPIFEADIGTDNLKVLKGGVTSVADLKSPAQVKEFISKLTALDDQATKTLSPEIQESMRRSQRLLLYRHIQGESGTGYWDSVIPTSTGSLSTRLDQLKSDLQRYMIIRDGLNPPPGATGAAKQSFEDRISNMLTSLEAMRKKGGLSQAQYIEARTAILGTQLDYYNLSTYKRGDSRQTNILRGLSSMMGSGTSNDLLGEVASGNIFYHGNQAGWTGRFGKIKPHLMRKFGSAPYEYSGLEYNPFQGNSTLVPTFSTAFARNPKAAIASVMGLNTWSNTQAFSGSSIISGHLIERLNHSMGIFGATLDPTKYRGPLDLYARGLIGRRMLPLVAAGSTALAVDRTIGGYTTPKDENGERVYRPFVLGGIATGIAQGQAALAGLIPGGKTYEQKHQEIFEGEVPVRSGRWWPLGNTPWKGGRVQYYRPSWYRRLMGAGTYTDQTWDSPLEKLAFGYDYSPGRLLDPYRFEREHYRDRPYPASGEYFTGPWGPLTSALNMTVGRLMKPQVKMHEDELRAGLSQYLPTGQQGAYLAPPGTPGAATVGGPVGGGSGFSVAYGSSMGSGGGSVSLGTSARGSSPSVQRAGRFLSANNQQLMAAGQKPLMTGRNMAFSAIDSVNAAYQSAAYAGDYGPSNIPGGMSPKVYGAAPPLSTRSLSYQTRQLGYEAQELFGIYGFAFGALRDSLGLGNQDMTTPRPVLESASRAYSSTRAFWNLGIGGLGDFPSPLEGNYANIEVSEILRRFIPKERTGTQFINPLQNEMGKQYPWLPNASSGYYLDFASGDPYTKATEGEMRLPGTAYERFNKLHPDQYGKYGLVDMHKILGDVAPWSQEYRTVDKMVSSAANSQEAIKRIEQTRAQVIEKSKEHEFTPYKYKYSGIEGLEGGIPYALAAGWEKFQHMDSPFHTKFMPNRTALEDWERENVYGQTFPQWQNPISDFVEPMLWKSTQRNPFSAAIVMAATGSFFGKTSQGKAAGAIIGGIMGFAASSSGKISELLTGRRYIPTERRQQASLEEYVDILSYVKNTHLATQASMAGDTRAASEFRRQASSTMYGLDVENAPIQQLVSAVPRRRREYMQAFINAPEQERDQILSTAPRLERRILEAVWGRPVEKKPELEDYFTEHELPGPDSSVWHPNTSMDQIKIKVGQSMGLDMAQMGVYPQEIQAANMVNPAYPSITEKMSRGDVTNKLRTLLRAQGISGDVYPVRTPYTGSRVELQAGVF